ncbi:hypothetical protein M8J77_004737 [Diaphorina citri]|nr:hypothetical protein M8J77_004737 [Diaphorina citri]
MTKIECNFKVSKDILIQRGVCQGCPISPLLFNIAVNFVYNELCDPVYADRFGYKLHPNYDAVSLAGFADDKAVASNSKESAVHSIQLIQSLLHKIGIGINPKKSHAIILRNGTLYPESLSLLSGDVIRSISSDECIKYLGCSFNDEIKFDHDVLEVFTKNCQKLITSPLLKPDQKLNVINQYLSPTLIYPLQIAQLSNIPNSLLEGMDIIIRRTVKAIVGLPTHTITSMLYAPRNVRGLGILNCKWELYLQHYSIASKLSSVNDEILHISFDCNAEMKTCVDHLKVEGTNSRELRSALRTKSFEEWSKGSYQGIGVKHFADHKQANAFITNKNSLSSSEWVAAIKLSVNYANLAGVPGVQSSSNNSNLCRRCFREKETLPHVLGSCCYNEQLVTSRHHKIKRRIIELLKEKQVECYEEVSCVDSNGSRRFCDIVAFPKNDKKAYILDPTIRYESNDNDQAEKVDKEKKSIYEPCIEYLKEKYSEKYPNRKYEVIGIWFGSRGTISKFTLDVLDSFNIQRKHVQELSETIIKQSLHILHNHIYSVSK